MEFDVGLPNLPFLAPTAIVVAIVNRITRWRCATRHTLAVCGAHRPWASRTGSARMMAGSSLLFGYSSSEYYNQATRNYHVFDTIDCISNIAECGFSRPCGDRCQSHLHRWSRGGEHQSELLQHRG